jgi:hypothetical protein
MLKIVGLMLATLVNWASAQSLPDSVYTCSVPAAELARAIEHIESRLGVEAARTCVLEHDEVFVKMGDGVYQGIAGWELTLRFRPCPSRDEDCALVLSTMMEVHIMWTVDLCPIASTTRSCAISRLGATTQWSARGHEDWNLDLMRTPQSCHCTAKRVNLCGA